MTVNDELHPCVFTLRKRNGPIVEQIAFDKLSGEPHITPRGSCALVQISGEKGAVCEIEGERIKGCRAGLDVADARRRPFGVDAAVSCDAPSRASAW